MNTIKLIKKHLYLIHCLLIISIVFQTSSVCAQKQSGYFGDSVLYELSMRMYDSLKTPAFFQMREKGLSEAIAKKSAHFDFVFRISLLSRYEVFMEKEKYMAASDSIIQYYKKQGDIPNIYNVWVLQVDRLQMWGDYAQAIVVTRHMADYAQENGQELGIGCANYCFARCYHNNHQNEEAERYYRLSFSQLTRQKKYNYAISSGFNIMGVMHNKGNYKDVITMSDSLPPLIRAWEKDKGIAVNPVFRLSYARLRLRAFCMEKNIEAATMERDSMFFYNRMYADPAQQIWVQEALASYEKLVGNYPQSERDCNLNSVQKPIPL